MPENKLSYIICFTPRAGGWLLGEALRETGIAGIPEEWCNTNPHGTNETQLAASWGVEPPERSGSYKQYLEKMHANGTTANGVFGLRIQFSDLELLSSKLRATPEYSQLGLREIMPQAFPNLRYIWLTRRDKVRQAVSYARALQSDIWRIREGAQTLTPIPVDYDEREIAAYEASFIEQDKFLSDFFKLSGIEPITIYYEDLLTNYEQTVRKVLTELKVEGAATARIAPSRCVRLADDTSEEWVRRYCGAGYMPPSVPPVAKQARIVVPQAEVKIQAEVKTQNAGSYDRAPSSPMSSIGPRPKNVMRDLTEDLHKKRHAYTIIQRQLLNLNPKNKTVPRRSGLSREQFLEEYYSLNRPVVLTGMMDGWQALNKWTPEYLKNKCGNIQVEISADRSKNPNYETEENKHRKTVSFGEFIDMVDKGGETNDYYLTARNEFFKIPEARSLLDDMVIFPEYLNPKENWMFLWYGPKGTYTPVHHDSMNIFMAQVKGRKSIKLAPAAEMDLVYNHWGVYSHVDFENPDYNLFPKLRDATILDVMLNPGEVLFLPAGWWHSVRSLDMSITVTFMNFIYNNRFEWVHPNVSNY